MNSAQCFITIWVMSGAILFITLKLPMNNIVLIMLEWIVVINSLQTGEETDFILVSCTGLGIEPTRREQVLKAKKVWTFFFPSIFPYSILFFMHLNCILEISLGWGRFIKKIRPWIHYNSPWSAKGNYPHFVVIVIGHKQLRLRDCIYLVSLVLFMLQFQIQ